MLLCFFSQVPDDPTLEELSPRVPRAVFVKQDNGGSASVIPVSSARGPPGEEEKEEAPNSPDLSACSATYSNLGEWTLRKTQQLGHILDTSPGCEEPFLLNSSMHLHKGSF